MEDILDIIVSRRSVKRFKSDMIDTESIEKVVKAGMYAPTGKNSQSPIILAITNKEVRDNLSRLLAEYRSVKIDPFYNAPVILVVLADKGVFTHTHDGSCVLENMLLEAHSIGLGACWIHHMKEIFESDYCRNLLLSLGIDSDKYEGVGSCILGYSDISHQSPLPRKENYVYYVD